MFPVVETEIGRLGAAICYDWLFPEAIRALALGGAEVLIRVSAYMDPWGATPPMDWWTLFNRARAVENFAFVVAANQGASAVELPAVLLAGREHGRRLRRPDPRPGRPRPGREDRGRPDRHRRPPGRARPTAGATTCFPTSGPRPILTSTPGPSIAPARARLDPILSDHPRGQSIMRTRSLGPSWSCILRRVNLLRPGASPLRRGSARSPTPGRPQERDPRRPARRGARGAPRGLGHMERYEYAKAAEPFREVHKLAPRLDPRLDQPGDRPPERHGDQVRKPAKKAGRGRTGEPTSTRPSGSSTTSSPATRRTSHAHFCRGLILEYPGAILPRRPRRLLFVAERDPTDGHAWYKVGETLTDPDDPSQPPARRQGSPSSSNIYPQGPGAEPVSRHRASTSSSMHTGRRETEPSRASSSPVCTRS